MEVKLHLLRADDVARSNHRPETQAEPLQGSGFQNSTGKSDKTSGNARISSEAFMLFSSKDLA